MAVSRTGRPGVGVKGSVVVEVVSIPDTPHTLSLSSISLGPTRSRGRGEGRKGGSRSPGSPEPPVPSLGGVAGRVNLTRGSGRASDGRVEGVGTTCLGPRGRGDWVEGRDPLRSSTTETGRASQRWRERGLGGNRQGVL